MSAIPGFQDMMLPVLEIIKDGREYGYAEVEGEMNRKFGISQEDQERLTGKRKYRVVYYRLTWAKWHLKRHGLVREMPGKFQVSQAGKKLMEDPPIKVNLKYLNAHYPVDSNGGGGEGPEGSVVIGPEAPRELIDRAADLLKRELADGLHAKLKNDGVTGHHFEKIVGDVFRKLNYGVVKVIGRTNDGGVDIEIKRDDFGLDTIYCQAKKYSDAKITPEQVRGFAGALDTKRAKRGVFVTLSDFTEEARRAADSMTDKTIKLINGPDLIELMIEHGVGTNVEESVQIKKIDGEYFELLDAVP